MGVAIGLVYLTMLITFGKARIPFIILSALVFVPIGSFVALFLAGEPLSISVMINWDRDNKCNRTSRPNRTKYRTKKITSSPSDHRGR